MGRKILAIEGKRDDDYKFIRALLGCLGFPRLLSQENVYCLGGDGEFENQLKGILQGLNKGDKLAFIRDAESKQPMEHLKSFQSNIKIWKKEKERKFLNLLLPTKLGVFEECQTQVGIFIMPSEDSVGCIEDLCIKMICEQPLSNCVENFFACVQKDKQIKSHLSKKKLFLELALRLSSSSLPFAYSPGSAAERGYFNFKQNLLELDKLKQFLEDFAK
jgi:hypothetical protein